jgi:hypothetical protein
MELFSIALPRCEPNNFPLCTDISIIGFAMSFARTRNVMFDVYLSLHLHCLHQVLPNYTKK